MASETKKHDLTPDELIAAMERLPQTAAAWVIDVSARELRDHPAPRDSDGRYDVRQLVAWQARRLKRPDDMSDVDQERMLTAAESVGVLNDATLPVLVEFVASLTQRYGDAGKLALFDAMFAEWLRQLDVALEIDTPEARRRHEAAERAVLERQQAVAELRYTHKCRCGNIRRGSKWLKGKLPADHVELESVCPSCEKRGRS